MGVVSSPSPLGTGPTHGGASSVPTRSGAAGEELAQRGRGTARTVVARERQWMMGGGLRGESHHPAPRACSHSSARPGHAVMVSSLARSPQPATSWGKLGATSHERNRPWAPPGATRRRRDTAPNAEPPLDIAAAPPHRLAERRPVHRSTGRGHLERDAKLLEHGPDGREPKLPEQPRKLARVAADPDAMAEGAQRANYAHARLTGVKLPRMQVDDRWTPGARRAPSLTPGPEPSAPSPASFATRLAAGR